MAGGIFISYRRDDAKHAAGRLVDRLVAAVGRDKLFMDVDNIEPGLDFIKVLNDQVARADVLLALIGPQWLDARDARGQRRLDSPSDFVRVEIEAALNRDIRVVPVLLDGAEMPPIEALPPSLHPLVRRQAVRISHERFAGEADNLAGAMKRALGLPEAMATLAAPAPFATPSRSSSNVRDMPSLTPNPAAPGGQFLHAQSIPDHAPATEPDSTWPMVAAVTYALAAVPVGIMGAIQFGMNNLSFMGLTQLSQEVSGALTSCLLWALLAAAVLRRRSARATVAEATTYWFGFAASAGLAIGVLVNFLGIGSTESGWITGAIFAVLSTIVFYRRRMRRHARP